MKQFTVNRQIMNGLLYDKDSQKIKVNDKTYTLKKVSSNEKTIVDKKYDQRTYEERSYKNRVYQHGYIIVLCVENGLKYKANYEASGDDEDDLQWEYENFTFYLHT